MIPLPPHRTKGPGVLGATPEQPIGPFGCWPDGTEDGETDLAQPATGPRDRQPEDH